MRHASPKSSKTTTAGFNRRRARMSHATVDGLAFGALARLEALVGATPRNFQEAVGTAVQSEAMSILALEGCVAKVAAGAALVSPKICPPLESQGDIKKLP